jgi:hypothetical protein
MLRRILFELAGVFKPVARKTEYLLMGEEQRVGVLPETADELAIANTHDLSKPRDSASTRQAHSSRRHRE